MSVLLKSEGNGPDVEHIKLLMEKFVFCKCVLQRNLSWLSLKLHWVTEGKKYFIFTFKPGGQWFKALILVIVLVLDL